MVFAIIFRTPFLQLPIILMANGQLAKIAIYIFNEFEKTEKSSQSNI